MCRNYNVEIVFSKKRISMKDRKVGMQGMLGKVCVGILGNVGECKGMLGNFKECLGMIM